MILGTEDGFIDLVNFVSIFDQSLYKRPRSRRHLCNHLGRVLLRVSLEDLGLLLFDAVHLVYST